MVTYSKVPTGTSYTLDHTALAYGIDPQGRLRVAWRPALTAADLAQDVQALLGSGGH